MFGFIDVHDMQQKYEEKIKTKQNLLKNQNSTNRYDLPKLIIRKNFAVDASTHCT